MVPARDVARTLTEQMTGLRQYFTAAGEGGKDSRAAVDKVLPEIAQAQAEIDRAIASAAQVQNAMDSYDGLPTAAQLKQVDWAWEDAATAVRALNKLSQESIPAAYASMKGAMKPPPLNPVAMPARP